jgi:hypothetical protein
MTERSHNCIVCAEEFSSSELHSEALSKINSTKFKVCANCLDKSDPAKDYKQVRDIVKSYLKNSSRNLFGDAFAIVNSSSKKIK